MATPRAADIVSFLCRHTFENALCLVDRSYWTGYEADVLIVHRTGLLIDVEIKVSRDDFKADAKKHKWWTGMRTPRALAPGEKWRGAMWPSKVWKHYIALPKDIWDDKLLDHCSPASGILLLTLKPDGTVRGVESHRRCKANPNAKHITPTQTLDIARLASLRMLEAYRRLDVEHRKSKRDGTRGPG